MENTISQTRVRLLEASGRNRNSWNKLFRKLYIKSVKDEWNEVCKQNLRGSDLKFIRAYAGTDALDWEYAVVNNVNISEILIQDITPQKKQNTFYFTGKQRKSLIYFIVKSKKEKKIEKRNIRRVHKRFKDSIDVFIEKLQKKYNSDSYKDRFYKRNQEVSFPLFSLLMAYARDYGRPIERVYGQSINWSIVLGSYVLLPVYGQGVHLEITKMDEPTNNSIDNLLKDKKGLTQKVNQGLERELQRQKQAGKKFISDKEIDDIVDRVIKEELGDAWKEKYN